MKVKSVMMAGAVALILFTVPMAAGDLLVLHRGDVLKGELVRIEDGFLEFTTPFAGRILMPVDQVEQASTQRDMLFTFAGGRRDIGRLVNENGEQLFASGNATSPVALESVVAVSPLSPDYLAFSLEEERRRTTRTSLEAGYRAHSGTVSYSDPFARFSLTRQGRHHLFLSTFALEVNEYDWFPAYAEGSAEWRMEPTDRFRPRLALDLRRDLAAALDLRSDLALSLGRTVLHHDAYSVDVEGGVAFSLAYYDAKELWRRNEAVGPVLDRTAYRFRPLRDVLGVDSTWEEQDVSLRFRLLFEGRGLPLGGRFSEDIRVYPSLGDLGDIRAHSRSALLFPLTSDLHFKLNLDIDFDSAPPLDGLDEWQTRLGASLLWDF